MKKVISCMLIISILIISNVSAFAYSNSNVEYQKYQNALQKLENTKDMPLELKGVLKKEITARYEYLTGKRSRSFNPYNLTSTFKKISTVETTAKVLKEGSNAVITVANDTIVSGIFMFKAPPIAIATTLVGGVIYVVGRGWQMSLAEANDNTRYISSFYMRWKDETSYTYECYGKWKVTIDGHTIESDTTGTWTGDFES